MVAVDWNFGNGAEAELNWSRSFSEPDLTASHKKNDRFIIKHPHEYIAVDDLKFFRRRQPLQLHTHSNICLYNREEPTLSIGSLKSEYTKNFRCRGHAHVRPRSLLRRATSLRLEGLMLLQSEQQEKYHWFTPEDLKFSRTYPVRNPENLQLGRNEETNGKDSMKNSSFITYPMVDASSQILPRQMFRDDKDPQSNRLLTDKFKRDVAAHEQQRCHLQMRAQGTQYEATPSEYKHQFVEQFPIEKAHSIPQISSIKMQGDFVTVPEYQDSFKMYANYSKSAPIKKHDNLRVSGAEQENMAEATGGDLPEYRDKFNVPPKHMAKEKSLKTDDHLRPRGEFTKEVPEYYESFRDPQITEMPERGKVREPYLRLRGKIEFNPEYRNNYLDFPRSRPVVRKPVSSFRLPTSNSPRVELDRERDRHMNMERERDQEPTASSMTPNELAATPEYRRAQYNYQLRERERPREMNAPKPQAPTSNLRKSSDSSLEACQIQSHAKRRPSRQRPMKEPPIVAPSFEDVAPGGSKKPARYGRRASVLQNAVNCREKSSVIEGNPKYAVGCRRVKQNAENQQGSFVVLDEPCKPSNWMKKTWYDS